MGGRVGERAGAAKCKEFGRGSGPVPFGTENSAPSSVREGMT